MSTIDRERSRTLPPLVDGERLDPAAFMERYEAMPPRTRAELIGGVVVMASPVGRGHGIYAVRLGCWVSVFARDLAGVEALAETTVLLDERGVPQPDAQLRVLPEFGGQTRVGPSGYVEGAPELVIEVAVSSRTIDLGPKLSDYERAGVLEYLVVTPDSEGVHWFVRRGERLAPLAPGPDGVFRSEAFPGLWLDPPGLFEPTLTRLLETLERGRTSPEFAAFRAGLDARGPRA